MNENRVRLRVMGISYSPMQSGAFALLLSVDGDSTLRIPVVIGPVEAQAIAIRLERKVTPRPLTHDLFATLAGAFGVQLVEVFIYRFEDGIYSSEMTFTDGERTVKLDARTSDAVAVAMRVNAPIFTTPEIVAETGIELEEVVVSDTEDGAADEIEDNFDDVASDNLSEEYLGALTIEQLQSLMTDLAEVEEYNEAARVLAVLKRKQAEAADSDTDSDPGPDNE